MIPTFHKIATRHIHICCSDASIAICTAPICNAHIHRTRALLVFGATFKEKVFSEMLRNKTKMETSSSRLQFTILLMAVPVPWWRHQMETFSALLAICAGNSPVSGGFPAQRPVTQSFDVFFDLRPNKRLNKQWWGWWFETLSSPSRGHCNAIPKTSGFVDHTCFEMKKWKRCQYIHKEQFFVSAKCCYLSCRVFLRDTKCDDCTF